MARKAKSKKIDLFNRGMVDAIFDARNALTIDGDYWHWREAKFTRSEAEARLHGLMPRMNDEEYLQAYAIGKAHRLEMLNDPSVRYKPEPTPENPIAKHKRLAASGAPRLPGFEA
jgi:hypothetical protein